MKDSVIKNKIHTRKTKLAKLLLKWSLKNFPEYPWRKTIEPYKIMIAELLLQRTRATNVVPVYEKFLEKFPDIKTLSNSSLHDIEKAIKSLGIKSRSVKIKSISKIIVNKYSGILPTSENNLKEVFGCDSRYTVNAIRCFSLNQNVPIFDVNVQRVFARIFSIDFGKDAHKKKKSWDTVSYALPQKNVKRFNWALLDLGKTVCISTTPKCKECPLISICDYGLKIS